MDLNTRLFLRINNLVGKNRWLDAFGRAGAEWVVVAMVFWLFLGFLVVGGYNFSVAFKGMLFFLGLWVVGMLISAAIGYFLQKTRPHMNHPESKMLFWPMSNWKTFPSDHAFTAFTIVFVALVFGLPGAWALIILALWVGWGRVFAGVHYPFDILGGLAVAILVCSIACLFFQYSIF